MAAEIIENRQGSRQPQPALYIYHARYVRMFYNVLGLVDTSGAHDARGTPGMQLIAIYRCPGVWGARAITSILPFLFASTLFLQ